MRGERKSKSLVLRISLAVFAVYVVISMVKLQVDINAKRKQLDAVKAQCEELRLENKELERYRDMGDDKEYIQRIIQEKFDDYVFSDEIIYKDSSGS